METNLTASKVKRPFISAIEKENLEEFRERIYEKSV
jgi:hypothetical protein